MFKRVPPWFRFDRTLRHTTDADNGIAGLKRWPSPSARVALRWPAWLCGAARGSGGRDPDAGEHGDDARHQIPAQRFAEQRCADQPRPRSG